MGTQKKRRSGEYIGFMKESQSRTKEREREIAFVDARGFERAQVPLHQEEVVTQK
jgi:hypothetical protein